MTENESKTPSNFIKNIIEEDIGKNKNGGRIHTRFPPEPNGYLHIGHAKSICLNFGVAAEYNGQCNLRFDDTNPSKEEAEYVESIIEDVKWLGYDWEDRQYYASGYFEQLYLYAEKLIVEGKAYVCDLSINLFRSMRAGKFEDGSHTLRAKIDMLSGNINMRDPVIYRIQKASHHMTGDRWCIYPMYDYAHCVSDSIEKITHSLCTLEFEDHRPLYDWFLEQLGIFHSQQIEFARLNISHTVLSKRKLLQLVNEKHVNGWDDPRMPTLSGLRRRGYTPESIRNFCERIGVAKADSTVDTESYVCFASIKGCNYELS
jgi:glutaminyl-tRNA synthetase